MSNYELPLQEGFIQFPENTAAFKFELRFNLNYFTAHRLIETSKWIGEV